MPESHWDKEKGIKPEFGNLFKELSAFKATEDSRKLTLPKNPQDLPMELPKDFVIPQGVEFKLNPDDPIAKQAQQFAIEAGLSKDQFSKLLSLYAGSEITRAQSFKNSVAAEVSKLGATATARVTAVETWLAAQLGEPMAKHMATMLVTAQHVEGFEKIMASFRSQGVHVPTGGNEAPREPNKVDDAAWSKMSNADKLNYARQFDQSKFTGNGRAA